MAPYSLFIAQLLASQMYGMFLGNHLDATAWHKWRTATEAGGAALGEARGEAGRERPALHERTQQLVPHKPPIGHCAKRRGGQHL